MKEIVELVRDNSLRIMRSTSLIDKVTHYEAKFTHRNGYVRTEYFIEKSYLLNPVPFRLWGGISITLYVNATKYDENPEYWIDLIKTFRK